jgi:hypothetical protein
MAAENEEKSAPSLIQGLSKRNMTTGAGADLGTEFAAKRTKAPLSPAGTPRAPFKRCENHPIWSFASLGGFVIRSAQRTQLRLFLGSSVVEHSTVNRMVAGSNPARGAKQIKRLSQNPKSMKTAVSAQCLQTNLVSSHLVAADQSLTSAPGATRSFAGWSSRRRETDRSRTFSAGVMQKQNSAFEFIETFHRRPPVPFGFGANILSRDGADRWHVFWPLGAAARAVRQRTAGFPRALDFFL